MYGICNSIIESLRRVENKFILKKLQNPAPLKVSIQNVLA